MKATDPQHISNLFLDQEMAAPKRLQVAGGLIAVCSTRCPGKATPNEDAAVVISIDDHTGVLAVADGVGGSAGGEQAAQIAVSALKSAIDDILETETQLRTAIINGIEQANKAIQELGTGAATTISVVELRDGTIRPYHVGDSLVLVVGGRGKIKLQTVAHSPVGYGVEAGMLNEADAMHHEDRHVVSNVVGSPQMHIAIGPAIRLAKRDTVLLASDGLSDNLHLNEIIEHIRKGDLKKSTTSLMQQTRQRMESATNGDPSKPDDLTVVAFRQNGGKNPNVLN